MCLQKCVEHSDYFKRINLSDNKVVNKTNYKKPTTINNNDNGNTKISNLEKKLIMFFVFQISKKTLSGTWTWGRLNTCGA